MRIFGGDRLKNVLEMMKMPEDEAIEHKMISRSIESAQKKVEGHNFDMRKRLVQFDDVMNRHREVIYKRRRKALISAIENNEEIEELVQGAMNTEARHLAGIHAAGNPQEWNLDQLTRDVHAMLGLSEQAATALKTELATHQSDAAVEARLTDLFQEVYEGKKKDFGEVFGTILRSVYLRTIDLLWVEHLNTMQELRTGIGLQGYAQNDPLVAYKSEGYRLFQQLVMAIDLQTMRSMFRVQRIEEAPAPAAPEESGQLIG
jgi:preprotein translocase subunit SecA